MIEPTMNVVTTISGVIVAVLGAMGLFYKTFSESRRKNQEAESKKERDALELTQLAAKFNIEVVTGASTSAVSLLTGIADRLKAQIDESDIQIAALKQNRAERDEQIAIMQQKQADTDSKMGGLVEANKKLAESNQKLTEEVEILRAQLLKKDEVIQEQDGRLKEQDVQIQKQEQKISVLETEYQQMKQQVDELTLKLQEAEAKVKESGGGKDE